MRSRYIVISLSLLFLGSNMPAQTRSLPAKSGWTAATPAELEAALPLRALVEKERIETEMTSASGVVDARGRVIAAVVLITAGYAAQGKYSHYMIAQAPLRIGGDVRLQPGAYVVGWVRVPDGLEVHIYEAETGRELGSILARPQAQPLPVVALKIWPPAERSMIQIGRFMLPYSLTE